MSSAQCTEHQKLLDMVCAQCDVMICSKCFLSSHSSHRIVEMEEVFRKRKGRLKELLESAKSWQAQIKEKTDEVRSSRQSMQEAAEKIKEKIDETFRGWSDDLETLRQNLGRDVDEETEQRMKVFDDHLTFLDSANTTISNLQTEINTTLSKDTTSVVELCGSMEKSHEKVGKKSKETIATSFVPPKDFKIDICAPWMEEAIQNIKLVELGQGEKNAFARSVSMTLQENETLQRTVQDLQLEAEEYQLRIEDTERRKEEISYQLEDERRKIKELTNEFERIQELRKAELKNQFDELKRKILQTSLDQVEIVMKHLEDKEKSLLRLLDIHGEHVKLCPVCNKSFPMDVADEDFDNHVMDHVEGICPICRMTKGENMTDDDFMRHVNKHYDEENDLKSEKH